MNRLLLEAIFPDQIGRIYVAGWRPVMIAYGVLGLAVAAAFWFVIRDRPDNHPWCNAAEQQLIAFGRPDTAPSPHGPARSLPWSNLLTSRSMWLNCFAQVGVNVGWVFLVTWFPRYLIEAHHVPILERGAMASTPLVVGWLGMFGGGRLTDWLVRRLGLRLGRSLPWACSRFIGTAAFLICPYLDSPWAVTIALSFVALSTDLGTAAGWAYCQDVGGRYVGSILGWGNMWGNFGATASPILLAWVFESFGWTPMFMVCAASFLAAGLLALGIDATIPIAPREDEPGRVPAGK
jgi:nitrate/nitrite transporter NarK